MGVSNKTKLRRSLFACCKRRAAPTQATCSTIRSTFSLVLFFGETILLVSNMHLPVKDHFWLREVVRIGVDFLGIAATVV